MLLLLAVGLAASISLSEAMLVGLGIVLVREWVLGRVAPGWPLVTSMGAFAGWTLISAAGSAEPVNSVRAASSVFLLAALWVVLHAVGDAARARWFASVLFGALVVVAALSIIQVTTCSGERREAARTCVLKL